MSAAENRPACLVAGTNQLAGRRPLCAAGARPRGGVGRGVRDRSGRWPCVVPTDGRRAPLADEMSGELNMAHPLRPCRDTASPPHVAHAAPKTLSPPSAQMRHPFAVLSPSASAISAVMSRRSLKKFYRFYNTSSPCRREPSPHTARNYNESPLPPVSPLLSRNPLQP